MVRGKRWSAQGRPGSPWATLGDLGLWFCGYSAMCWERDGYPLQTEGDELSAADHWTLMSELRFNGIMALCES